MKPSGKLIIIAEAYKGGKYDRLLRRLEELKEIVAYAHLGVGEHRELFSNASYCDVQVIEEYDKGWISTVGSKAG